MDARGFKDLIRNYNGFIKGKSFDLNEVVDFKGFDFLGISSVIFEECEFKEDLTILNINNSEVGLELKNCKVKDRKGVSIFNSNLRYLTIKVFQTSQIEIRKLEIEYGIHISSLKDVKLLRIKDVKSPSLDVYCDTSVIDNLVLNNKEIEETSVVANYKINDLKINRVFKSEFSREYGKVAISNGDFDTIEFSSIIQNGVEIKTNVEVFKVFSTLLNGALIFNEINIEQLTFYSVLSQNGIFLCNNSEFSTSEFYNTSLKNVSWNNVNFKQKLMIDNSDFSALKYANINWIKKTKFTCAELQYDSLFYGRSEKQKLLKEISDLINDREVYRQLKVAATGSQNYIDALEFYRLEMRLYWKEMRISRNVHWSNRILVFLNRWVSDFGQSWLFPLGWLFLINIFYMFYMQGFHFSWCIGDWVKGSLNALYYMNPAREFLNVKEIGYTHAGFDIFIRVINAFLLYHFVRATRKYGKV